MWFQSRVKQTLLLRMIISASLETSYYFVMLRSVLPNFLCFSFKITRLIRANAICETCQNKLTSCAQTPIHIFDAHLRKCFSNSWDNKVALYNCHFHTFRVGVKANLSRFALVPLICIYQVFCNPQFRIDSAAFANHHFCIPSRSAVLLTIHFQKLMKTDKVATLL